MGGGKIGENECEKVLMVFMNEGRGEGGGGISVEECECTVTLLLKLETHFKSEFQAE